MKYIAERGYTDVVLNRHVDKDEPLEEIYKEAAKELTDKRKNYLINERKLYIAMQIEDESNREKIINKKKIKNNKSKGGGSTSLKNKK